MKRMERISLADTKVSQYNGANSYQTNNQHPTTRSSDRTKDVHNYNDNKLKPKQIIYFILVLGILVATAAVSFFVINHSNKNNSEQTTSSSTKKSVGDLSLNGQGDGILTTSSSSSNSSASPKWFKGNDDICVEDPNYLKESLKLQYSVNVGGILLDLKNSKKYEASGVRYDWTRNKYFVVFDSLYGLGSFDISLQRSDKNNLIPDKDGTILGESGFEGIAIDRENDDIYLVTEAINYGLAINSQLSNIETLQTLQTTEIIDESKRKKKKNKKLNADTVYQAVITHISLENNNENNNNDDSSLNSDSEYYEIISKCLVNYNFTSENKGIEGLSLLQNSNTNEKYFLGLCEGNYCKGGNEGRDSGHGRILIIQSNYNSININGNNNENNIIQTGAEVNGPYNCIHPILDIIKLPKSVFFTDYSDMSFRAIEGETNQYRVIIASQEDSAIWIGSFDLSNFEFSDDGDIYMFPKDNTCQTVLCNVEGVDWIDDNSFVAASDKTKSKGRQDYQCSLMDQGIHIFTIP